MTIQIIADGPADLEPGYYKENGIWHVPHGVHYDGKDFQDRVTIQPKELMDAMRNGAVPTTSQGSLNLILDYFVKIAQAKQKGIYIVFSSGLSGTYSSAVMLKEQVKQDYPDFEMEVIDSKSASLGLGFSIMACAELVKKGASYEDVIATAKFFADHTEAFATVETLEYLAKGGRMKRSAAFFGGMLNIKPLLTIDNGDLVPFGKYRGKKKVYEVILEQMAERGDRLSEQTIGICHADCASDAEELQALIKDRFGASQFKIIEIGASISAHTGPGTVAVIFLNQLQKDEI